MRKELLFAIASGFILGLIIMGGIWTANKAIKNQKGLVTQNGPEINLTKTQITSAPSTTLFLTILKPDDQSIINTDKVIISGNTLTNVPVVIIGENSEKITQSDGTGNFDNEISLILGVNEITVTAFSPDGEEISKTVNLVYSKEEI